MGLILTENDLRSHPPAPGARQYQVEEGTFVTESARSWLEKRDIQLVILPKGRMCGGMSRTPLPDRGSRTYLDAATGLPLGREKPEEMTHLRGNLLVKKSSPRIAFRGKLDSLEAAILEAQALAHRQNAPAVRDGLGEVLEQVHLVLGAEVKDQPLEEVPILGMDQARLRQVSHNVKGAFGIDHPIPSWEMGELALRLNTLRTQVRETELAAAVAFEAPGETPRPDIIRALNRLSSAVYILFCKLLAEK
ncbi:MAG: hypothetical protein HFF13_11970 [Angelakisella sp.]|jgi:ethanolamine utilization cobalamin adenosyltransferase|nr:hypothetical protein [Angelakisella sp.]